MMSLVSSCRRHELHVASCSVVYDYVDVLMLTCYAKSTSPLLQPVPLTVPVLTDTGNAVAAIESSDTF
jgi:hypothetical protein